MTESEERIVKTPAEWIHVSANSLSSPGDVLYPVHSAHALLCKVLEERDMLKKSLDMGQDMIQPKGLVPCRFGIEVEGPFKGDLTLVIPNASQHSLEAVQALLTEHNSQKDFLEPRRRPKHLWLETQPGERFNWDAIYRLKSSYRVTLQVREPEDVPPQKLLQDPFVAVVWMVPDRYAPLLHAADFIKHATAPGYGYEAWLKKRTFDPLDYAKDEVWP